MIENKLYLINDCLLTLQRNKVLYIIMVKLKKYDKSDKKLLTEDVTYKSLTQG